MAGSNTDKSARLDSFVKKIKRDVLQIGPPPEGWNVLERMMSVVLQLDEPLVRGEATVTVLSNFFSNWNEVRVVRSFELRDLFSRKRISKGAERAELVQQYLRRVFGMQNHLELDWMLDATSERRQKLLDAMTMVPDHLGPILDIDALEEGDKLPVGPEMKLLCARLGLVKTNPKESVVREIIEPLMQGDCIYRNYVAMRLLSCFGCKAPKSPSAILMLEAWADRAARPSKSFDALLTGIGFPEPSVAAKKHAAKKKATKKSAGKS